MSRTWDCALPDARTRGLSEAASAVRRGELVVLPTDTLYGVGADAFSPAAVGALLAAKGRGRDLPVPVLVGAWRTVTGLVDVLPPSARDLVSAFWPGGLSLVLRHSTGLAWDLGDTRGTVLVRMPLHPVAIELLADVGPMAVSSANRSGSAPATTAADAHTQLGEAVSVYLDAGRSPAALASTIVDCTGAVPRLLRVGVVAEASLREVVPDLEVA